MDEPKTSANHGHQSADGHLQLPFEGMPVVAAKANYWQPSSNPSIGTASNGANIFMASGKEFLLCGDRSRAGLADHEDQLNMLFGFSWYVIWLRPASGTWIAPSTCACCHSAPLRTSTMRVSQPSACSAATSVGCIVVFDVVAVVLITTSFSSGCFLHPDRAGGDHADFSAPGIAVVISPFLLAKIERERQAARRRSLERCP